MPECRAVSRCDVNMLEQPRPVGRNRADACWGHALLGSLPTFPWQPLLGKDMAYCVAACGNREGDAPADHQAMRTDPCRLLQRGTVGRPALGTACATLWCPAFARSPAGRFRSTSYPLSALTSSAANALVFPMGPVRRAARLLFLPNVAARGRCGVSNCQVHNGMSPIVAVDHPSARDPHSSILSTEPRARGSFFPATSPTAPGHGAICVSCAFCGRCFG